jgi:hypothetical protein
MLVPHDDLQCITQIEMPLDTTFSIAHVATLLLIVSKCQERYHPLKLQCYWLCLAIIMMIRIKYLPVFRCGEAYKQCGRYLSVPIMQNVDLEELEIMEQSWQDKNDEVANHGGRKFLFIYAVLNG